ncbi:MAG: putative cytoplasmic protein [Chthonomonadaceae bacterium]|nr:putative cytoplasmic protein [Chthonomonadaceae bacterium]
MTGTLKLTRPGVRRAMVRHHFAPCVGQAEAFDRLRSVQFDPLAPVGCNHDLVLQARVPGYKVGDWRKIAYEDRQVYDGWDKMASLVPFAGWPLRRHIYTVHRRHFEKKIFEDHKEAVDLILKEIADRGPLMPKECEFQQRKEEWKGSWFGPSVTKQTLRALWHSGLIMTAGRKNGQHIYDLTERVVPSQLLNQPLLDAQDAVRELVLERHRAMGLVRPAAPPEVWSYSVLSYSKRDAMAELVQRGEIIPVEVDGVQSHATPGFLSLLDQPPLEPRVVFVAPLDQFMWDRKMIAHLFGFDYVWEVYVPEAKRRWGYYVLPVLFGDSLVARAEFWCRAGVVELRRWHFEQADPGPMFFRELERALGEFMNYCSATRIVVQEDIDPRIRDLVQALAPL